MHILFLSIEIMFGGVEMSETTDEMVSLCILFFLNTNFLIKSYIISNNLNES